MWGTPGLVFFLPERMCHFTENSSLYQHRIKEIVELLRKFSRNRNWVLYTQSFNGIGFWYFVDLSEISVYVNRVILSTRKSQKQCT